MPIDIPPPRSDPDGLRGRAALWCQLHEHHRAVSDYPHLVEDTAASWASRHRYYRRLLEGGASYLTAHGGDELVGYAMVAFEDGPDDTFAVTGGVAEVVTLVVSAAHRSAGVGRRLLAAAEQLARARGYDTVKIAVMAGNARAASFYAASGYQPAETVLYRRLGE